MGQLGASGGAAAKRAQVMPSPTLPSVGAAARVEGGGRVAQRGHTEHWQEAPARLAVGYLGPFFPRGPKQALFSRWSGGTRMAPLPHLARLSRRPLLKESSREGACLGATAPPQLQGTPRPPFWGHREQAPVCLTCGPTMPGPPGGPALPCSPWKAEGQRARGAGGGACVIAGLLLGAGETAPRGGGGGVTS